MEPAKGMVDIDGCGKRDEAGFRFAVGFGFGSDYGNSMIMAESWRPLHFRPILHQTQTQPRWGR